MIPPRRIHRRLPLRQKALPRLRTTTPRLRRASNQRPNPRSPHLLHLQRRNKTLALPAARPRCEAPAGLRAPAILQRLRRRTVSQHLRQVRHRKFLLHLPLRPRQLRLPRRPRFPRLPQQRGLPHLLSRISVTPTEAGRFLSFCAAHRKRKQSWLKHRLPQTCRRPARPRPLRRSLLPSLLHQHLTAAFGPSRWG